MVYLLMININLLEVSFLWECMERKFHFSGNVRNANDVAGWVLGGDIFSSGPETHSIVSTKTILRLFSKWFQLYSLAFFILQIYSLCDISHWWGGAILQSIGLFLDVRSSGFGCHHFVFVTLNRWDNVFLTNDFCIFIRCRTRDTYRLFQNNL